MSVIVSSSTNTTSNSIEYKFTKKNIKCLDFRKLLFEIFPGLFKQSIRNLFDSLKFFKIFSTHHLWIAAVASLI